MRRAFLSTVCVAVSLASAQKLEVYSQFRRIDPWGRIVSADRIGEPREILSPMVARNAHAGFFLVAEPPPGEWATVYVGQNPEDAVTARLYRVSFLKSGDNWVPSQMKEVKLPFQGRLPDHAEVPGQKAFVFWLDVWVAPDSPVRRIKLEPQLNIGDRWLIYPMEVRIMPLIVPPEIGTPLDLLTPDRRSDSGAMARLRAFLCGGGVAGNPAARGTIAYAMDRLVLQDMAAAKALGEGEGKIKLVGETLRAAGAVNSRAWCEDREPPPNVDWYLRFRDALYRAR